MRNLPEASAFYRTALGLELVAGSAENGYCVFQASPVHQPWGGVLATLRDPAGNELQIVQQPAA